MKINSRALSALFTVIALVAFTLTGFAESPYPSGSIADSLVTANGQLLHASTRAAGITALGTQLTAIEALDNTTTIPVFQLVGIVTYLGSCRDVVDANGTSATTKRVDAAIVQVKAIIAYKRANSYNSPINTGYDLLFASLALGSVVIGRPTKAYGKAPEKDAPAPKPNADQKPIEAPGVPLHGDPTAGQGQTVEKRDETELAKTALNTSVKVTTPGGTTTEIQDLLARAETVRDGSEMPREDIVTLRINLQRFRGQNDALATKVDEETNRLEALILGLPVKEGKSITGQTRNKR